VISLKATETGMRAASARFAQMLDQIQDLRPFMNAAADYMVRSTKYRVRQGRTSPNGEPFQALSELTRLIKGHDKPLYASGQLYDSIHKDHVTNEGFVVRADPRSGRGYDYAPSLQFGNRVQRGVAKTPDGRLVRPKTPAPERPFLGFSEENLRRLERMLAEHVLKFKP